jgi:tRNA-splicing ligase RtcB (3'-phosphate/5'-hydroxy nucleic acid ligase)
MPVQQVLDSGSVPVHIYADEVDPSALAQLHNLSHLPIVHHHVAAMPDVHAGIGATVGTVLPTRAAVIPAAVGVDIGCGMIAVCLGLSADRLPARLDRVRGAIEAAVPVGFEAHATPVAQRETLHRFDQRLGPLLARHPGLAGGGRKGRGRGVERWARQLGTLGGGNHFIEVCIDEREQVWVMLHSGSRGTGNLIGRYFIARARERMLREDARLPDRDLAWLAEGEPGFDDYIEAVGWAQDYALANRREMMRLVLEALTGLLPPFRARTEAVDCHHNYVARERHFGAEVWVTRKGAIRAGRGEYGIIPGSMGARSFIVRGRGNADSFESCAHGAGRRMSRTEARRRFRADDVVTQTEGVECRKDAGVVDEIPAAYKDIDRVMGLQEDLVEIVHTLRQVVCVKG